MPEESTATGFNGAFESMKDCLEHLETEERALGVRINVQMCPFRWE